MNYDDRLKKYEQKVERENLYGASGPGQVGAKQTDEGRYVMLYRM